MNPIHVFPLHDLREHMTDGDGSDCWCDPEIEDGGRLIVHRSADDRESLELGLRKPN